MSPYRPLLHALAFAWVAGALACDLAVDLHGGETLLFMPAIWLTLWASPPGMWSFWLVGALGTIAAVAGGSAADWGSPAAFGTRMLGVVALWGTAVLAIARVRAQRELSIAQGQVQTLRDENADLRETSQNSSTKLRQSLVESSVRQQQVEQALRDSEALYHSLVDHLPLSVLRKDTSFRYTFVSRRFLEFSGKQAEEILDKTDFDLFPENLAHKYRAGDEGVRDTGRLFDDVEAYQKANGELRYIQVLKTPVRDGRQQIVGTQIMLWDVTDRKRAEEAMEKFAYELERRNLALQKSEEEVRSKNQDLETLLYVTSHDLREPLRAIENFSKLIRERYAAAFDDKGRDFLERVIAGAVRLDRLLEDVLTLSRVERTTHAEEDVSADDIVAEVLKRLDPRVRETGANVRVITPLPRLRADRRWFAQAAQNLISNALKYTQEGRAPDVEIAGYSGPEGVGLVVRDRGMGVPDELSERIFGLFQRGVGRNIEGTGAGLAIVKRVAERHGGRAWVRPRVGGGSEFIITFGTGAKE